MVAFVSLGWWGHCFFFYFFIFIFSSVYLFFLQQVRVFPLRLGLQCDGWLIGRWWAGLVAGLRVGRIIGLFYHLEVGFAVSVSRLLVTQTPLAT